MFSHWNKEEGRKKVNSGQAKLGQVKSVQVKSGQVKLGEVKSAQVMSGQVKSGLFKLRKVKPGQVKLRQVTSWLKIGRATEVKILDLTLAFRYDPDFIC